MLIDLSHPLQDDMPVYPGDGPVKLRQERHLEQDGFNAWRLSMGLHAGTHVDTPLHMTPRSPLICNYPLEQFFGKATVVDIRGKQIACPDDVEWDKVKPGDIILFCSGHDALYGTPAYFSDHPVLSEELGEMLALHKVGLVGMDMPSPDRHPFSVHHCLFAAGICIVENLKDLNRLLQFESLQFCAFPLSLDADASPVRAVAFVDETMG